MITIVIKIVLFVLRLLCKPPMIFGFIGLYLLGGNGFIIGFILGVALIVATKILKHKI